MSKSKRAHQIPRSYVSLDNLSELEKQRDGGKAIIKKLKNLKNKDGNGKVKSSFNLVSDEFSVENIPKPRFKEKISEKKNELNIHRDGLSNVILTKTVVKCTGNTPSPRIYHASCLVDSKLYIHGGIHNNQYMNQLHVLNLQTFSWKLCSNLTYNPVHRYGHSLTPVGNQLYLFGGISKTEILNDLHVYDLDSKSWYHIETEFSPPPRYFHTAYYSSQNLYIIGGIDDTKTTADVIWSFNIKTMDWKPFKFKHFVPRAMSSLIKVEDENKVIVFGGYTKKGNSRRYVNKMNLLNFDNFTIGYSELKKKVDVNKSNDVTAHNFNLKLNRIGATSINNTIVCIGGENKTTLTNQLRFIEFSPLGVVQTLSPQLEPIEIAGHSVNSDGSRIFIFGGKNSKQHLNELIIIQSVESSELNRSKKKTRTIIQKKIKLSEIKTRDKIASGATCSVHLATYSKVKHPVVIKKYYEFDEEAFSSETRILNNLKSKYVVKYYGCVNEKSHKMIVLEYLELGDLSNFLAKKKENGEIISIPLRLSFAYFAAKSMAYLHGKNIMHRDLKSTNLLVASDNPLSLTIKVMDFGDSSEKPLQITKGKHEEIIGTTRWTAPEILNKENYHPAADVYSYGIILWELLTQEVPFKEYRHDYLVHEAVVERDERPKIPDDCMLGYKQLIESCWNKDWQLRPSFQFIVVFLAEIISRSPDCKELSEYISTTHSSNPEEYDEERKRKFSNNTNSSSSFTESIRSFNNQDSSSDIKKEFSSLDFMLDTLESDTSKNDNEDVTPINNKKFQLTFENIENYRANTIVKTSFDEQTNETVFINPLYNSDSNRLTIDMFFINIANETCYKVGMKDTTFEYSKYDFINVTKEGEPTLNPLFGKKERMDQILSKINNNNNNNYEDDYTSEYSSDCKLNNEKNHKNKNNKNNSSKSKFKHIRPTKYPSDNNNRAKKNRKPVRSKSEIQNHSEISIFKNHISNNSSSKSLINATKKKSKEKLKDSDFSFLLSSSSSKKKKNKRYIKKSYSMSSSSSSSSSSRKSN